jgi:hypothetical protein
VSRSARRPVSPPAAEPAPRPLAAPPPRTWQGVLYRPSQAGAGEVRRLFDFAGAWAPAPGPPEFAWEAAVEERLVGGVLVERQGEHGFIHGPVVVAPPAGAEPLEMAAQLVAPLLRQAADLGINTLFARPQGLDRLWVRFGFIPVPEASVPAVLRGRPGTGLHAWRRPGSYTIAVPDGDRAGRRGRTR